MRNPALLALSLLALSACAAPLQPGGDVACTADAMECPDGSYVGREPPFCQFAACPGASSAAASASAAPGLSVSDGTISFTYASPFALAMTPEDMPKNAYIPPCDQGFLYCLYHDGKAYAGTTFESAALGIARLNAATRADCLGTQPAGYADWPVTIREEGSYATSLFSGIGDAAMGHYVEDEVYRLSPPEGCYELRLRIGQSNYENYESGSILRFEDADEAALRERLRAQLGRVTFADGGAIMWPQLPR